MISLKSRTLVVTVAPELGGRIVSVFHHDKREELLFQNPRPGSSAALPGKGDAFPPWAWGWDECWPLVDPEVPGDTDHGDLWCQRAEIVEQTTTACVLKLRGLSVPADITKTVTVDAGGVEVALSIRNTGTETFHGFWTCHPLLRITDDMTLFPEISFAHRKFVVDGTVPFSGSQPPPGTYGKFWVDQDPHPTKGSLSMENTARDFAPNTLGIHYPALGMEARLTLLEGEAPYVGFWVTRGGFQGDRNAAWEFSDGFHDSPGECRKNGAWPVYRPGEEKKFRYRVGWGVL